MSPMVTSVPMEDDRAHGTGMALALIEASNDSCNRTTRFEPLDIWADAAYAQEVTNGPGSLMLLLFPWSYRLTRGLTTKTHYAHAVPCRRRSSCGRYRARLLLLRLFRLYPPA